MKRMKRLLAVLLIAAMALPLLAGCWNFSLDSSNWTIENGVLVVPEGVTQLTKSQVEKVSGDFTSVILPSSLTSIGDSAFEGNTALTSVTFRTGADSRTALNPTTGWINFTAMAAANSASGAARKCIIGQKAFYGCSSLTTITGWEKVTSIGDNAFQGADIRGRLDLSNVTHIGKGAFEGCTGITAVIVAPEAKVDDSAFSGNVTVNVVGEDNSTPSTGGSSGGNINPGEDGSTGDSDSAGEGGGVGGSGSDGEDGSGSDGEDAGTGGSGSDGEDGSAGGGGSEEG